MRAWQQASSSRRSPALVSEPEGHAPRPPGGLGGERLGVQWWRTEPAAPGRSHDPAAVGVRLVQGGGKPRRGQHVLGADGERARPGIVRAPERAHPGPLRRAELLERAAAPRFSGVRGWTRTKRMGVGMGNDQLVVITSGCGWYGLKTLVGGSVHAPRGRWMGLRRGSSSTGWSSTSWRTWGCGSTGRTSTASSCGRGSEPHAAWWREFLRDSGGARFWHETSSMHGGMEAISDDLPNPISLQRFATEVAVRRSMFGARMRARASRPFPRRSRRGASKGPASPGVGDPTSVVRRNKPPGPGLD